MQISFLTAFFGGVLALLSPCGALLLPAFFASTVGNKTRLAAHGGVFYIGLVVTLVPVGLGLGALGSLVATQRGLIIAITAALLILLGVAQTLGFGFDLSRVVPGANALRQSAANRTGFIRTLLLGAVSGIAGFCAGPILGAILTLAIAQGSTWAAGALLAVYGAGMVIPLVLIAALWQRSSGLGRQLLRGRAFTVWGRQLHTTSVITGALMIVVGVLFWLTNGLVSMPSLVPTEVQTWTQDKSSILANPIVDVLGILALAGLAFTVWTLRRRRREQATTEVSEPSRQRHGS